MALIETAHVEHLKPSETRLSRAAWVDAFAVHMSRLGTVIDPEWVVVTAETLHEVMGDLDPIECAEAEHREWGPMVDD